MSRTAFMLFILALSANFGRPAPAQVAANRPDFKTLVFHAGRTYDAAFHPEVVPVRKYFDGVLDAHRFPTEIASYNTPALVRTVIIPKEDWMVGEPQSWPYQVITEVVASWDKNETDFKKYKPNLLLVVFVWSDPQTRPVDTRGYVGIYVGEGLRKLGLTEEVIYRDDGPLYKVLPTAESTSPSDDLEAIIRECLRKIAPPARHRNDPFKVVIPGMIVAIVIGLITHYRRRSSSSKTIPNRD